MQCICVFNCLYVYSTSVMNSLLMYSIILFMKAAAWVNPKYAASKQKVYVFEHVFICNTLKMI